MATCTALADAPISSEKPLDGVNLILYIKNEILTPPHDYILENLIMGDWRLEEEI